MISGEGQSAPMRTNWGVMFDLIIRNGTIVDGTGRARFVGDVAVRDGLLVQVGGTVVGDAIETVDATGLIVTPGFVDIHTHFDGQVTWDDLLEPSASHGVTTIVAGNCGVGFAPVLPERRDQLVQLMEGVEDIPGSALTEGMTWDWVTFPDYLDALEKRSWSMDVGTQITHGALRVWVMGDRAIGETVATRVEVDEMARLVAEAIGEGALGFSTSRTFSHKAPDGNYVPGTFAGQDELWPIAAAMKDAGRAVFQLAPLGTTSQDPEEVLKEFDWMRRLSLEFGLVVSPVLAQIPTNPGLYREVLDAALAARVHGAVVIPQVSAKSQGLLLGLQTSHAFMRRPTFVALSNEADGDLLALVADLRKPETKAAILSEEDLPLSGALYEGIAVFAQHGTSIIFPISDAVDQEPQSDQSVASLAEAAGVSALDMTYDLMLERDGRALLMAAINNYADASLDGVYDMLTHPGSALGLSDAGAHCGLLVDASMPTMLLTHWVRDRTRGPRIGLESAVRMQTFETAELYGLGDRGVLAAGKRADINVIDFDALELHQPEVIYDLPAGGRRLVQRASGYKVTVVAGTITRRDDVDTGARPGRLIRGTR
jgi:N-acyl-D-amino-acid deacylase